MRLPRSLPEIARCLLEARGIPYGEDAYVGALFEANFMAKVSSFIDGSASWDVKKGGSE